MGARLCFSLRMLGMFMVLPILTSYGIHLKDSSELLVGVAIGIYGLSQAIFQIPFGLMSDKIGRKPLIVFGLMIFIIGSVLAALSDSIWGSLLVVPYKVLERFLLPLWHYFLTLPANRIVPRPWLFRD